MATERVTIVDVAKEANVSFATVSRVVNGKGNVSSATRERVQGAMLRTGYVANRQARGLAGGRYSVAGVLVPDLDSAYVFEVVRGIDEALAAASYDLMLYTTHRRTTRESAFVTSMTQGMIDGLLLILPFNPGAYLESVQQRGMPYVLIDHSGLGASGPSVGATNVAGGHDATAHLLSLGHRRIGLVTGIPRLGCAVDRQIGYERALTAAGIPLDPALVRTGDFHQPRGYEAARELLALPDPPTAIVAANDLTAFGAMDAVRDAGLRIPDDVSIVGFDDIAAASSVRPRLTTVRQPLGEMGRLATEMLLARITDPDRAAERVELPTELVVRDSTAAPRPILNG